VVDYTLETVWDFVRDKRVILVGNSAAVLFKEFLIDSYDVVCRIDDAFPFMSWDFVSGPECTTKAYDNVNVPKALGTRTDILFLTPTGVDPGYMQRVIKPKFVIRTRKSLTQGILPYHVENSIEWTEDYWHKWGDTLSTDWGDFHPTSGCVSFQFLLSTCQPKSITLYGFDFWRSANFWGLKCRNTHAPDLEERWFRAQIAQRNNVEIVEV